MVSGAEESRRPLIGWGEEPRRCRRLDQEQRRRHWSGLVPELADRARVRGVVLVPRARDVGGADTQSEQNARHESQRSVPPTAGLSLCRQQKSLPERAFIPGLLAR